MKVDEIYIIKDDKGKESLVIKKGQKIIRLPLVESQATFLSCNKIEAYQEHYTPTLRLGKE